MTEHLMTLGQEQQRRVALQRTLEPAELIEQHRERRLLAKPHQVLCFVDQEVAVVPRIGDAVEESSCRAFHGVELEDPPRFHVL